MSEQTAPKPLETRLRLKDQGTIAFWPKKDALPEAAQHLAVERSEVTQLSEADVVLANLPDRASAVAFFDEQLTGIAAVPAIWLVYPKGNRTDINRDSLWSGLLDYGWRPVSNISVDDTHSSIRVRPLKPGESGLPG